jgi:ribosomal protein L37AE/L43A
MVSEADQKEGAKTLSRTNRVWWQCPECGKTGKGAANLTIHQKRAHAKR